MADDILEFESFVKTAYVLMLNYCIARGQSREDADEIVNDAFFRMWRAWEKCGPLDRMRKKKWLYNTIDNIIRERRKKRAPQIIDIDEYIDMLENEDDEIKAAFESIEYDIYIERIRGALSESEYEIFDQAVVKGRTYKEAAAELGIREDAARARMMRMREKIRRLKDEIFR